MTRPSIKIVSGGTAHISVVRDIAYRTWPAAYGDILSPGQIGYMLSVMYSEETLRAQLETGGHRFFLAELDGEFVGYIGYELDADAPGTTRIHKLYALPDTHGRGVGHALLRAAMADVRSAGQDRIRLNVNRFNPSVRFYERQGFVKVGEEDLDFGGGYFMNDFIMERAVAGD